MEKLLVLVGTRKGPFTRVVGDNKLVFKSREPVSVTDQQFEALKNDLGTALLLVKDVGEGVLQPDWDATKKQCLADAEAKVKKGEPLSFYQNVCFQASGQEIPEVPTFVRNPAPPEPKPAPAPVVEETNELFDKPLKTQQDVADEFDVELSVVKEWCKQGLVKKDGVYDPEDVAQYVTVEE